MYKLLQLKHWQLFLLLFGIPMILQFVFIVSMFVAQNPTTIILMFPIIMILFMGVYFSWFYALDSNLHKKLPATMNMNLTTFKIFLFIPVLYILFLCIFLFGIFSRTATSGQLPNIGLFALIIPVHLFSMFCIFYCLYFVAKTLKAVEMQRPVTFSDFAGEFFLIWFFPIGVWIIQPRINKLFDENIEAGSNLIG